MQQHFVFLEHIVGDLSHQLAQARETAESHRRENLVLLHRLQDSTKQEIGAIQNLAQRVAVLETQMGGIGVFLGNSSRGMESHRHGILQQESKFEKIAETLRMEAQSKHALSAEINELRSQIRDEKTGVSVLKGDVLRLSETVQSLKGARELVMELRDVVQADLTSLEKSQTAYIQDQIQNLSDRFRIDLEGVKSSRSVDMSSVVGVVEGLKTSVSGIRKELKEIEDKIVQKMKISNQLLEDRFNQNLEQVSRPLIVASRRF